jgi:hypothetical protein
VKTIVLSLAIVIGAHLLGRLAGCVQQRSTCEVMLAECETGLREMIDLQLLRPQPCACVATIDRDDGGCDD